jgi:hypothetical protein
MISNQSTQTWNQEKSAPKTLLELGIQNKYHAFLQEG